MKLYFPLALMTLLTTVMPARSAQPRLVVGEPFPTLALPSITDGEARSIAEFRGQKLLLHIFASW